MAKYAIFNLQMPHCGSWNGKWSLEGLKHAIAKVVDNDQLDRQSFFHDFGDGWVAKVTVHIVEGESAKDAALKDSEGFAGYEWMAESILRNGEIKSGN